MRRGVKLGRYAAPTSDPTSLRRSRLSAAADVASVDGERRHGDSRSDLACFRQAVRATPGKLERVRIHLEAESPRELADLRLDDRRVDRHDRVARAAQQVMVVALVAYGERVARAQVDAVEDA